MTAPVLQLIGNQAAGTAAQNAAWPAGHQAGDLGILVIENSGNDTTQTGPSGSGWTQVTGSPVTDVATTAGSKLVVWYKFATSSTEANVSTGDAGDHQVARIYVFRGVSQTGTFNASTTGTKTTASTTATWPSITTTVGETRVVFIASRPDDTNTNTDIFRNYTGGTLDAVPAELSASAEATTSAGNGGGFVLVTATKTTPGATGTPSASMFNASNAALSVTNAYMVFALRPKDFTLTADTGTFNETLEPANLLKQSKVIADNNAVALSLFDATLTKESASKPPLVADVTPFSLESINVTFKRGYRMVGQLFGLTVTDFVKQNTFTDDFNRADNPTDLGSNWITRQGSLRILNNEFYGFGSVSYGEVASSVIDYPDDHSAEITIKVLGGGDHIGPAVRVTSSGCYVVRSDGIAASDRRLQYITGTTTTTIGTVDISVKVGDVLKLTAIGSVLTVYINNVKVDQVTNAVWTTGQPGVFYNRGNVNRTRGDDFFSHTLAETTNLKVQRILSCDSASYSLILRDANLIHAARLTADRQRFVLDTINLFGKDATQFTRAVVNNSSLNTTIVGSVPSATVDGDLLIAFLTHASTANPPVITAPAGWTTIQTQVTGNANFYTPMYIGYRIANNEPANYTWTLDNSGGDDDLYIYRVSKHRVSTIDISASTAVEGTSITAPSITTTTNNNIVVYAAFSRNGNDFPASGTVVGPENATQFSYNKTRTFSSATITALAYEFLPTPRSTGTKTFFAGQMVFQYSSSATFAIPIKSSLVVGRRLVAEPALYAQVTETFSGADLSQPATLTQMDIAFAVSDGAGNLKCDGGARAVAYTQGVTTSEHYSEFTITALPSVDQVIGVGARIQTSGTGFYYFGAAPGSSSNYIISEYDAGVIATSTIVPRVGDRIRIEARGSTLYGYVNGILACQATDSTYLTGRPGVVLFGLGDARADNLQTGPLESYLLKGNDVGLLTSRKLTAESYTPVQLWSDDFTGAEGILGSQYTQQGDALLRLDGLGNVYSTTSSARAIAWPNTVTFSNNQYAEITLTEISYLSSAGSGVVLRLQTNESPGVEKSYFFRTGNAGEAYAVAKYNETSSVVTILYTTIIPKVGDRLKAIAVGTTLYFYVNDQLIASVSDNSWSTGVPGIYGFSNGWKSDNFVAGNHGGITVAGTYTNVIANRKLVAETSSYTLTLRDANILVSRKLAAESYTPVQLWSDDFTGAEGVLGSNYTQQSGVLLRLDGLGNVYNNIPSARAVAWPNTVTFSNNQYAEITLTQVSTINNGNSGIILRIQTAEPAGTEKGYTFKTGDNGQAYTLREYNESSRDLFLANTTIIPKVGDRLKAVAISNTLYFYVNNQLIASVSDNSWSTGVPGIYGFSDGWKSDNFVAGNHGGITVAGTYTNVIANRKLVAETSSYTLTLRDANLLQDHRLTADTQSYTLVDNSTSLITTRYMGAGGVDLQVKSHKYLAANFSDSFNYGSFQILGDRAEWDFWDTDNTNLIQSTGGGTAVQNVANRQSVGVISTTPFAADQWVEHHHQSNGSGRIQAGPLVRASSGLTTNGYSFVPTTGNPFPTQFVIIKYVNGVGTILATSAPNVFDDIKVSTMYRFRLEAIGNKLYGYINEKLIVTATDNTFSTGQPGFQIIYGGSTYDFFAGEIDSNSVNFSFTENQRTIEAISQSYQITSEPINILRGIKLLADTQTYSIDSVNVDIKRAIILPAVERTYSVISNETGLFAGRSIALVGTSLLFTGPPVPLSTVLDSHSITINPPAGWALHLVTDITQAGSPACIYYNLIPAVSVGDQILFRTTTDTNGWTVSVSPTGIITSSPSGTDTVKFRHWTNSSWSAELTKVVSTSNAFSISPISQAYDLGEQEATLRRTARLIADSRTYDLAEQEVTLRRTVRLITDSQNYDLGEQEVTLRRTARLVADSQNYDLGEQEVTLRRTVRLVADSQNYNLGEQEATLRRTVRLVADSQNYNLGEQEATLRRTARLIADSRTYDLAEQEVTLRRTVRLISDSQSYQLSTTTLNFVVEGKFFAVTRAYDLTAPPIGITRGLVLPIEKRDFNLSLRSANILQEKRIAADSYSVSLVENDVTLLRFAKVFVSESAYNISSTQTDILKASRITLQSSSYNINYTPAELISSSDITATTQTYTTQFNDINFIKQSKLALNTTSYSYQVGAIPITAARKLTGEGSRVNYILNSTMSGASVGALGSFPTTWATYIPSWATREIVSLGVDTTTGFNYIDVYLTGTNTSGNTQSIELDPIGSTITTAFPGQTWTSSAYFGLVTGTWPDSAVSIGTTTTNQFGENVGTRLDSIKGVLTSQLERISSTYTITNPTAQHVQTVIRFDILNGDSLNLTIRIAAPQLEKAPAATKFIPTINAPGYRWFELEYSTTPFEVTRKLVIDTTHLDTSDYVQGGYVDPNYTSLDTALYFGRKLIVNTTTYVLTGYEAIVGLEGLVRVWDGSNWQYKPIKVWTGTVWTQKPLKIWDGTTWRVY